MPIDLWKIPAAKRKAFARRHRSFISRVARSLDPPVSATAANLVFHRKATSARIKAALEKEMAAILRQEAAAL